MDEESGEQLFYNGDNPEDSRTGYGNSDFDRRHVFPISTPTNFRSSRCSTEWPIKSSTAGAQRPHLRGERPALQRHRLQRRRRQPVLRRRQRLHHQPARSHRRHRSQGANPRLQGTLGVNPGNPVLNSAAFGIPLLQPGQNGVPPCDPVKALRRLRDRLWSTSRNIFVSPFQSRVDMGVFKNFKTQRAFQPEASTPRPSTFSTTRASTRPTTTSGSIRSSTIHQPTKARATRSCFRRPPA